MEFLFCNSATQCSTDISNLTCWDHVCLAGDGKVVMKRLPVAMMAVLVIILEQRGVHSEGLGAFEVLDFLD